MGARLSIGMKEIPKYKERNFSMLYKTAKGKSKQKSGRKRPLTKDESLSAGQHSNKFEIAI